MSIMATCLGFPRIGVARELKKALEAFWAKKISAEALQQTAADLRKRHWLTMKAAGIDQIPSNDFSLYDHVLDMTVAVGAVPKRYQTIKDPISRYFAMARGLQASDLGVDVAALEMTKWFDTNYHYIVPELEEKQAFRLDPSKIISEIEQAQALGLKVRPVILGPVTFLLLAKSAHGSVSDKTPLDHLEALLPVYRELFHLLVAKKVEWIQLDEPCLVLDLDEKARNAYEQAFTYLTSLIQRPKILLTTYFGDLNENLALATKSGCEGLHLDLVRAPNQLDTVLPHLKADTVLSLGVVDGRNIWRTNLDKAHAVVRRAIAALGEDSVAVASSCSLLHVPVDLEAERYLDSELKSWLAFATQKLAEVKALADWASLPTGEGPLFKEARLAVDSRWQSPRTCNREVRSRCEAITESMLRRAPYEQRAVKQRAQFGLPLLPTTTIGSFPQTSEVRSARAAWRSGKMDHADYENFLRAEIARCVAKQEAIGLDVLVHGEFERNDMVEYFGEQLEGFAFTENGWVQSYGSRYVKPPLLYGDVLRRQPMTVAWSQYAQSLTKQPMKAMLTGPVTILQWSFVRDDQSRSATCMQIALALRDEVGDLEQAGLPMIQVDEPAIREGLPLRRSDWEAYLRWAVDAFRLATSGIRSETQIHTHMCYSEFGDILGAIAEMDADVLSIETSRSKMELLTDFNSFKYPNEVGPGVYDIHSPRTPTQTEMENLLLLAARVLPIERLWANPDCGLKTRQWPEVEAALTSMVAAARGVRAQLGNSHYQVKRGAQAADTAAP